LSTSFFEYSWIIQSSKVDKQKTPHRRPVRGFGVCSFPGIRNAGNTHPDRS